MFNEPRAVARICFRGVHRIPSLPSLSLPPLPSPPFPSPPLYHGDPGYNPRKILELEMHVGEFKIIYRTKI
jgi:hypothetical protein